MSESDRPALPAGSKVLVVQGSVTGLAVAVVIGAAFGSVMNRGAKGITGPLVGAFGTKDLAGYSSCLKGPRAVSDRGGTTRGIHSLWGSAPSATLTFLITAAVGYCLIVLAMARHLARRAARQQPTAATEPAREKVEEITLLRDIRDAPVAPRSSGPG